MAEEQQTLWMDFIRKDKTYAKYYDEFVVLLGTGMRVSEFCGLTKGDFDFISRKIRVDKQLVPGAGRKILCGKDKDGVRMLFHSYDRGSLSKSEKYFCSPKASKDGNGD